MTDDAAVVAALLQMHGLNPSEDERGILARAYGPSRTRLASLYSMVSVRYEEPAVIFDARIGESEK